MRSSAVIGLTAITLASAADSVTDWVENLPCYEKGTACALAGELTVKCGATDLSAKDSVECACNDYFDAQDECTKCLLGLIEDASDDKEATSSLPEDFLGGGVDVIEALDEITQRHKAKLCQQKEVKLGFVKALQEVTGEMITEPGNLDKPEETGTAKETTKTFTDQAGATNEPETGNEKGEKQDAVTSMIVTMGDSSSSVAPPSSTDASTSPTSTPASNDDQDEKEDGSKDDEDKDEKPDESAGAISMASAGIMALAAGSALLALF